MTTQHIALVPQAAWTDFNMSQSYTCVRKHSETVKRISGALSRKAHQSVHVGIGNLAMCGRDNTSYRQTARLVRQLSASPALEIIVKSMNN